METESQDKKIVVKHRDFALAKYKLSTPAQKILIAILTKVDSSKTEPLEEIQLTPQELVLMDTGVSRSSIYKNFSEICDELLG